MEYDLGGVIINLASKKVPGDVIQYQKLAEMDFRVFANEVVILAEQILQGCLDPMGFFI